MDKDSSKYGSAGSAYHDRRGKESNGSLPGDYTIPQPPRYNRYNSDIFTD